MTMNVITNIQRTRRSASTVDAEALGAELRKRVQGEVRFDAGSRALYATDGSNYRQVPIGVVLPRHAADIDATIAVCRSFGAPLLPRGPGRAWPVSRATSRSCWTARNTCIEFSRSIPSVGSPACSPASSWTSFVAPRSAMG